MGGSSLAANSAVSTQPVAHLPSSPRFEKLQHEMELATAQEESILQNDLLHQESPAEPSLQKPQNPGDGFTLTYYISSV